MPHSIPIPYFWRPAALETVKCGARNRPQFPLFEARSPPTSLGPGASLLSFKRLISDPPPVKKARKLSQASLFSWTGFTVNGSAAEEPPKRTVAPCSFCGAECHRAGPRAVHEAFCQQNPAIVRCREEAQVDAPSFASLFTNFVAVRPRPATDAPSIDDSVRNNQEDAMDIDDADRQRSQPKKKKKRHSYSLKVRFSLNIWG